MPGAKVQHHPANIGFSPFFPQMHNAQGDVATDWRHSLATAGISNNYWPSRVCLALLSARIFASLRQAESHPDVRHRGLPNRPASDSLRREETGARRHEHSDRFSGRLLLRACDNRQS